MKTIASQWEFFRNLVVAPHASEKEIHQAEVAFHAGAMCILKLSLELADDKISQEEGESRFQSWVNEMDEYAKAQVLKATGGKTH